MERWLPIPGFEGRYEVSDHGRVRNARGQFLTPVIVPNGYYTHHLYAKGRRTVVSAHAAVLAAFVGPRPPGMQVCHEDRDISNNRLSNLRYDTPAGNNADKRRHGTHLQGEGHPTAKLTEAQIKAIRADGRSPQDIADDYGCMFSNVSAIKLRKSWRHV